MLFSTVTQFMGEKMMIVKHGLETREFSNNFQNSTHIYLLSLQNVCPTHLYQLPFNISLLH